MAEFSRNKEPIALSASLAARHAKSIVHLFNAQLEDGSAQSKDLVIKAILFSQP
jgi:hypothetical protein